MWLFLMKCFCCSQPSGACYVRGPNSPRPIWVQSSRAWFKPHCHRITRPVPPLTISCVSPRIEYHRVDFVIIPTCYSSPYAVQSPGATQRVGDFRTHKPQGSSFLTTIPHMVHILSYKFFPTPIMGRVDLCP